MRLHNTLSRKTEDFGPHNKDEVAMYSCGPTVYDHIHIGNLSAFIAADMLRRALTAGGYKVRHVMNFTDVDDKTIKRSGEVYPDRSPEEALQELTREYERIFLDDMKAIGNDVDTMEFVRATDSIEAMQDLIRELHSNGFAYITDDGVYFSIEKYQADGKKYGQLLKLDPSSTSSARIDNDEYDKESVHDFALWKTRKENEPAWEFQIDGRNLLGRPGWHIECSAMSTDTLGQPFDIHTGGIDLIFPHHENEIAQSTAGKQDEYARFFVHNEHLLVDGKKMSKSLNNFYTLRDIQERGFEPLAFRLMVLQSHYRSQSNFTWDNLEAAQNRLSHWRVVADLLWQTSPKAESRIHTAIIDDIQNDMDTPAALSKIDQYMSKFEGQGLLADHDSIAGLLEEVDTVLGINLSSSDINEEQKALLAQRQQAREAQDWAKSDELRGSLAQQGIGVRDTQDGPIWHRL